MRASSGLDQSKIPFSQRKLVFLIRFLVVGVPSHSEYIAGATKTVVEDLKIPVYNMEDGKLLGIFDVYIC